MYAIVGILDEQSDRSVRKIWQALREKGFSAYAFQKKNMFPHVTLASFENCDLPSLMVKMEKLVSSHLPLSLNASAIGSFLGTNIITLNPIKTAELSQFHAEIHQKLAGYVDENSLYAPVNWVPHLTLANRVDENTFLSAYDYCLKEVAPLSGQLIGLRIIQLDENQEMEVIYQISSE